MKFKDGLMLILASGFGFLGGVASTRVQTIAAQSTDVVRTSRLEVVDASGNLRAVLGMDGPYMTLSFLTVDGKSAAELGVGNIAPFLRLRGPDEGVRLGLGLTAGNRGFLSMGDGVSRGPRMTLGAFESDDYSELNHAAWGLEFRSGIIEPGTISWIGMNQRGENEAFSGSLIIKNPDGSLRVPPE